MTELITLYWPYILAAFLIGLVVAWFAFSSSRKTTIKREEGSGKDVLDEGADRASRNEALINAPPAAGELSSAANTQEVAHVSATADAEAGPQITPEKPTTAEAPPSSRGGDDLTRIKGLGPKLAKMLTEQGITRFEQIAGWSDSDIERIDSQLGRFQGRIQRDSWVEQARMLSDGDEARFNETFGNT